MRREGYEFSVARPQVIFKKIDGVENEPWEEATIEIPEQYSGSVITALGLRKGEMVDMKNTKHGLQLTYHITTRNLIGLRSELLKKTSGMLVFNSLFIGYQPKGADASVTRNGVVVSTEAGQALSYSLEKVQNRAMT
ncbi:MAG: GTP-binding protein TypA, partial [Candidatus Roizmanbacteria bacterium GW2011_GWA1_41_13]